MSFVQNPDDENMYQDDETGAVYVTRQGQTIEQLISEIASEQKNPVPVIVILPTVTLWERMTEAEAEQVNVAMATQPFRTRQIFMTANTFRSDHELWPLLVQMATDLFGEARAAELLAP
ncbi:hypothetical protein [Brucella sp. 2280]|uniref:hypothetical protein n=1 Tax=Brucella sp. 2280 TaxID=2592625 RepID=UPI001FFF4AA0|nr:hypothetical protein [Brucella sp. 2280]